MGRRSAITLLRSPPPQPAAPERRLPLRLSRRDRRLLLGRAGVFSVTEAAELLPLSDNDARDWIRGKGLVRRIGGKPLVVWGDVLDALEPDPGLSRREQRRSGCKGIARTPLPPI